jgi:hypothetical protein
MSADVVPQIDAAVLEQVVLGGDLSRLTTKCKFDYYASVCKSLGLNQLTQPFAYIKLNGKEVLYAKRDCTDQLRKIHKVSITITSRETHAGVYVVTAKALGLDGRCDESTGAVAIENLRGDNLANAFLKAETKAKRRVTLSICGLGFLDETEIETIADARTVESPTPQEAIQASHKAEPKADQTEPVDNKQPSSTNKLPFDVPSQFKDAEIKPQSEYVISFGKYKGRDLDQLTGDEISGYIRYLQQSAAKDKKPLSKNACEFIEAATAYLKKPAATGPSEEQRDELNPPWPKDDSWQNEQLPF